MRIPPFEDVHHKTLELVQSGNVNVHFSQWGEDIILWHFLWHRRGGFYVDVGAHHPHYLSNTALLYHYADWSGINVEPDERLIEHFVQHRPGDTNLCCGVGAQNGIQRLATFDDGSVNSFDPEAVEIQLAHGGKTLLGWRDVRIRTLADILDEHLPAGRTVDVLNVDVEGWDLQVLQSNDWSRYQPEFILVEDHAMYLMKVHENRIALYLETLGYRLISQTLATSIYRREG
jgi:FkbM family methyltransferase